MYTRLLTGLLLLGFAILECACSGTSVGGSTMGTGGGNSVVPNVAHVIVVVEENQSYSDVVGSPDMPYLNSLIKSGALATQYFADAHPSLPNYFVLTAGSTITFDDNFAGTVTQNNIVRVLTAGGKSWRCYAESLPQTGYLGGDVSPYIRHHVPFTYFSDVQSSPAQAANIVPFTQFSADLSTNNLPSYAFVVPNGLDDGHDCPGGAPICQDTQQLINTDTWLQSNIDPLVKSAAFQNSILIITFDEGDLTDIQNGGGHVATVIVSPKEKTGYQSSTLYLHESTLRMTLKALGLSNFPGNAANATDMGEFF